MRRKLINVLIVVFACVFLVSAFFLVNYLIESKRTADQNDLLAGLHDQNKVTRPPITTGEPSDPTDVSEPDIQATKPSNTDSDGLVEVIDPETGKSVWILPEFADLYEMNNDIIGWIEIPGSKVNNAVMQSQEDTDYYLYRDFWGNKKSSGSIYIRNNCDAFAPSDNLTLYGHMMKDSSMFGSLDKYMKRSTWNNNPYIYFDTLTERHTYQIFAVFMTSGVAGEGFPYHTFIDAQNAEEFDEFVSMCKSLAYYDTGITPKYGDKLITLSTCDPYPMTSGIKDGRLVVVAVRVA